MERGDRCHVDVSVAIVAFFVSYIYESGYREVFENASPPKADVETTDTDHTFIVGSKITVIPQKLFINTNFSLHQSRYRSGIWAARRPAASTHRWPVYPDVHNNADPPRREAKYVLDNSFMRSAGFVGKAFVKFRVLWEKNTNDSWQSLQNQFGWLVNPDQRHDGLFDMGCAPAIRTTSVVMGQVSFGVKW